MWGDVSGLLRGGAGRGERLSADILPADTATAVGASEGQRSLYVPHSGHYMYRTVVTVCTASLTFNNSTFCPHTVFMCFVWI